MKQLYVRCIVPSYVTAGMTIQGEYVVGIESDYTPWVVAHEDKEMVGVKLGHTIQELKKKHQGKTERADIVEAIYLELKKLGYVTFQHEHGQLIIEI